LLGRPRASPDLLLAVALILQTPRPCGPEPRRAFW
jgi:hypothetical protein